MPDLYRGGVRLGKLTLTDTDQPWYNGRFDPAPAFADVKPLFDELNALLDADRFDDPRTEELYEAIAAPGLRLVWEDGTVADEMLIHIDGDQVHWRC
jgi:hypothetical protein